MEKGFVENGFIIDLSDAKNTTQLVFELSSIMEHPDVKRKNVCLKLGSLDLKQSQLLSIKALIESMDASIAFIDTNSEQTEASAVSLGIIVSEISDSSVPSVGCSASEEIKEEAVVVKTEDEVLSGCINKDGLLKIRVTKEFGESTVSKILDLVENASNKKSKSETKYEDISLKQSVLVGISQAIAAAFPGVSRSGITMTVARMLKIDRESAAKFSFLLAAPITLAAVLVDLSSFTFDMAFLMGVLASFVVGLFVIKFLLEYLKKGSFKIFAIYRILFGLLVFGCIIFR